MTTRCTVVKITRQDATVEGYTDHDDNLTISGVTYLSSAGYTPFSVTRGSELKPDNQELVGLIDNDNLSADDLLAGVYDGARLELMLVDWSTQTKVTTLGLFILGPVRVAGDLYTVEMQSIESELAKPIGRTVTLKCPYELGDSDCGYSLSSVSGSVSSVVTADRVITDSSRTEADDYFNGGKLVWTSGANNGRTMDVKKYTLSTKQIELFEPMPSTVAVSDTFDLYRGCDKTIATCINTFSNGTAFGGFPYLPGTSNLIAGNT